MKRICSMALLAAFLLTGCQSRANAGTADAPELLGLEWYSSIGTAEQVMSPYRLDDRSEEVAGTGQLQTLLEYDDVTLYERPCDVTLSFTDDALTGISYHDDDSSYSAWKQRLTEKFGAPSEERETVTIWEDPPIAGTGTLLLFRQDDDAQIAFFAENADAKTAVNS